LVVHVCRGALVFLITCALEVGLFTAAAQPVNDRFEQRSFLAGTDLSLMASNVGATEETEESLHWGRYWDRLESTVWWSWVAPTNGLLIVSIGTDDYPARFAAVFAGSALDELEELERELAQPHEFAPRFLGYRVKPGVEYQLVVSGLNSETGEFQLRLLFFPTPSNDDFLNAQSLAGVEWSIESSCTAATVEADELSIWPRPRHTLWWSWTAPVSGVFSSCLDAGPPVESDLSLGDERATEYELVVFTGDSLAALQRVAAVRDSAERGDDSPAAWLSFAAEAGVTYHFRADATVPPRTRLTLRLVATARPEVMVTNPIRGQDWRAGDTVAIMAEARDMDGQIARVEFGTAAFADTTWPYAWVLTDVSPGLHVIPVRAVDDRGVPSETVEASFTVRPVNDHFEDRQHLSGAPIELTGTLAGATMESFESSGPGGGGGRGSGSLWWSWTASQRGYHTITWVGLTSLATYQGDRMDQLELVASGGSGSIQRNVVLFAEVDDVYQIQGIGTARSSVNQFVFSIIPGVPPEVELTQPLYRTTVIRGQSVELVARAEDLDGTVDEVAFYADDQWLGSVTHPPYTWSMIVTQANFVMLEARARDDSGLESRSSVQLFIANPPPPNDAFADRIPLHGAPLTFMGNSDAATAEDGEPGMHRSTWWSWTPAMTGPHAIRAVAPDGGSAGFTVYRGSAIEELVPVVASSLVWTAPSSHLRFDADVGAVYAIALHGGFGDVTVQILPTTPPEVAIVHPQENDRLSYGSMLRVEIEASDAEGTLTRVDLYRGSARIGSLEAPPFVWTLPLPQFDSIGYLYAVAVDQDGAMDVAARTFGVWAPPPANDAFADRLPLPGPGVDTTADLRSATLEAGEPNPLGVFGTAWWTWEAPSNSPVTFLVTTEKYRSPALTVFTGTDLDALTIVGGGVGDEDPRARLTIPASAGKVYQFAVSGGENTVLRMVPSALPSVRIISPTNGSLVVEGTPIIVRVEAEDPENAVQEVALLNNDPTWPPAILLQPPFDFVFVPPIRGMPSHHELRARVTDAAGLWTLSDPVGLQVFPRQAPNDDFAARFELTGTFVRLIPLVGTSTYEPGEPGHGDWGGGSTWYSWRAPGTGLALVTLGPLPTGGATSLSVYTGASPTDLVEVTGDDVPPAGGSGGSYPTSLQAVFLARAGIEYQIRLTDVLSGSDGSGGSTRLQLWFELRDVSNLRRSADGALIFDFTTSAERDWLIEGSADLRQWQPLGTRRSTSGQFNFTDPGAADHPSRFYQLSPVP
jgi:hypothetical protein